jgi:hypothetical protein
VRREGVELQNGSVAAVNAALRVGSLAETITVTGETPTGDVASVRQQQSVGGVGQGAGGGRFAASPSAAAQGFGAVAQSGDLGELFEYRVTSPISIPRNNSALVPIIRSAVSIERVSLWNGRAGTRPVRALWVTNTSGLTLDAGAFTIVENGTFAGEGLVEQLKPDEKRLLSYAVDLSVQVQATQAPEARVADRVIAQRGVVTRQSEQRARRVYTIRNSDANDRSVVIEHPMRPDWMLDAAIKPVETTADAYRIAVPVPARQTVAFTVDEKRPIVTRYEISFENEPQWSLMLRENAANRALLDALQPIIDKKAAMEKIKEGITSRDAEMKQIATDQERIRENLQSLKDTPEQRALVKRFAAQLTAQEDRLEVLKREFADILQMFQQAKAELQQLLDGLVLDLRAEAGS